MSLNLSYSYGNDTLANALQDLVVRFVINCPKADLEATERLFFQIEEAQWYYEDFVRVENRSFPSMKMRIFCERLFAACPILHNYSRDMLADLEKFQSYKSVIPVCGAIILDPDMKHVVLVKGWKSGSFWGFPRGKINKDEPMDECAIREVYEEIGFDIGPYLVKEDYAEATFRSKNIRLYIVRGVPLDTQFCPQTRKEISKIEWHKVNHLPTYSKNSKVGAGNYFMVTPFIGPLKKYIAKVKGLATDLTKTESEALKKLLEVGGDSESDKIDLLEQKDEDQAAKHLLSLLKSNSTTSAKLSSSHQPPPKSDQKVLLDLLNQGGSKKDEQHQLESAREILSLLRNKMNQEENIHSIVPLAPPAGINPYGMPLAPPGALPAGFQVPPGGGFPLGGFPGANIPGGILGGAGPGAGFGPGQKPGQTGSSTIHHSSSFGMGPSGMGVASSNGNVVPLHALFGQQSLGEVKSSLGDDRPLEYHAAPGPPPPPNPLLLSLLKKRQNKTAAGQQFAGFSDNQAESDDPLRFESSSKATSDNRLRLSDLSSGHRKSAPSGGGATLLSLLGGGAGAAPGAAPAEHTMGVNNGPVASVTVSDYGLLQGQGLSSTTVGYEDSTVEKSRQQKQQSTSGNTEAGLDAARLNTTGIHADDGKSLMGLLGIGTAERSKIQQQPKQDANGSGGVSPGLFKTGGPSLMNLLNPDSGSEKAEATASIPGKGPAEREAAHDQCNGEVSNESKRQYRTSSSSGNNLLSLLVGSPNAADPSPIATPTQNASQYGSQNSNQFLSTTEVPELEEGKDVKNRAAENKEVKSTKFKGTQTLMTFLRGFAEN